MVYSDQEIIEARLRGQIVIFPFVPGNVKGSSVDVTLGRWIFATDKIGSSVSYNPRDPEEVQRYFRLVEAQPHAQVCDEYGIRPFKNIPPDQLIHLLRPHERILAHTGEFIGINPPGTTEMRARSSTGRNGIAVCKCAGWGDPGYINRWTMEIDNSNEHHYPLLAGERIAQIVFHQTGPVINSYAATGKYQAGVDLLSVVQNWTPEQMRPKSYTDVITTPPEPTYEDVELYMAEVTAHLASLAERGRELEVSFPN